MLQKSGQHIPTRPTSKSASAMAQTIHEVYANSARPLRAHGFLAVARAAPPAIITDADPMTISFAIGQAAIEPEQFLPNRSAPDRKAPRDARATVDAVG